MDSRLALFVLGGSLGVLGGEIMVERMRALEWLFSWIGVYGDGILQDFVHSGINTPQLSSLTCTVHCAERWLGKSDLLN